MTAKGWRRPSRRTRASAQSEPPDRVSPTPGGPGAGRDAQEDDLDAALADTFPASDPVAISPRAAV